jgi:hypothetical protein
MKELNGKEAVEVYWRNDPQYICVALNAKTPRWIAIGFGPSEWTKDADMIQGIISIFILQLLFSLDCLFVKLLLILP